MEPQSFHLGFRFGLRTLLVLITASAVVLGVLLQELNREHRRKQVAAEVVRLGGSVRFVDPRMKKNKATGVVNGWLRAFLGNEYFTEATSVVLTPRSAEDLDLLLAFPEVSDLTLSGPAVTDDSLPRLNDLTQVRMFIFNGVTLGPRGLQTLAKHPNLYRLHFTNCSLADESLKSLVQASSLLALGFDHCAPSEEGLKTLAELSNLGFIFFANCSLADADLRSMHGARSSVTLGLRMTNATEAGMLALREANPAWSIDFQDQGSVPMRPNKGYLPSRQLTPAIKELAFEGSLTSSTTLAALKDASSLSKLELTRCSVTDGDLQYVRLWQNLRSLSIVAAPITDEGVRALERRSNLERLVLGSALVSDEAVDHLAKMTSLRQLYLWGTSISDLGVARLQQALPSCEIILR